MAYIKQRANGTTTPYPHKMRVMLRKQMNELLSRYSLDEVLSEIATLRPSFDIRLCVAAAVEPMYSVAEPEHTEAK
jgi:hypothetical protein